MTNVKSWFLTTLLIAAAFVAVAPTAQAHECVNHDPNACDAGNCPDGEFHDHTDLNADGENYHCSSTVDTGDGTCYYPTNDVKLPPAVCDLLGYRDGECTNGARRNYQDALLILCVLN